MCHLSSLFFLAVDSNIVYPIIEVSTPLLAPRLLDPASWLAGTLLSAQQVPSPDAYHFHTFGFSGRGLPCHSFRMQTTSSEQNRSCHEEQCTENFSFPGIRSLAAGAAGGVCSVLVGHPFDLIKVRLQTADKASRRSALDVFKSSLTKSSRIRVCSSSRTILSSFDCSRASMQASRLH